MIIDFHTHTFPDRIAASALTALSGNSHTLPFSDGTAAGLLASQESAGIDVSVIMPVATSPRQVEHINDASALLNAAFEGRLVSFGAIHPDSPEPAKELARAKALGLPGIKLHPVYQGADIDDIRFLRILDAAAALDLIVLTHAGEDIGFPGAVRCSPAMIRHALKEAGPRRFIAAHMGGWRNWEEVPEQLSDTGCFLDTAFSLGSFSPRPDGHWDGKSTAMLSEKDMTALIRAFGADRVLFGTDSPWAGQKECLEMVRKLPLTPGERDRILGGNAARLLGLS